MPRVRSLLVNVELADEMVGWLLRPRTTRVVGAVCQSCEPVDHGPGQPPGPCTRPVWSDMLCARCWCMRMAFNGRWALIQANPAASLLSLQSIMDKPDIFGDADVVPPEWC